METIFGKQQGGRKGHNTKNRGKKGYRPVLCFIEETREYNECLYRPMGWGQACRFVVMRILKEEEVKVEGAQQMLLKDSEYVYRIFATNLTHKPHKVINEYDKRADCENLIGEAKREGLSAIPTGKFSSNYAYFQIVMLSYNIWRSFKMLAGHGEFERKEGGEKNAEPKCKTVEIVDNTIRIARLKLLFISSKITGHSNVEKVKYTRHDSRVSGFFRFLGVSR